MDSKQFNIKQIKNGKFHSKSYGLTSEQIEKLTILFIKYIKENNIKNDIN